jgi:hypothetical protein
LNFLSPAAPSEGASSQSVVTARAEATTMSARAALNSGIGETSSGKDHARKERAGSSVAERWGCAGSVEIIGNRWQAPHRGLLTMTSSDLGSLNADALGPVVLGRWWGAAIQGHALFLVVNLCCCASPPQLPRVDGRGDRPSGNHNARYCKTGTQQFEIPQVERGRTMMARAEMWVNWNVEVSFEPQETALSEQNRLLLEEAVAANLGRADIVRISVVGPSMELDSDNVLNKLRKESIYEFFYELGIGRERFEETEQTDERSSKNPGVFSFKALVTSSPESVEYAPPLGHDFLQDSAPSVRSGIRLIRIHHRPLAARIVLRHAVQEGVASSEECWLALEGIGLSFMQEKSYSAALPWFEKALIVNNKHPRSQYNIACSYCRLGQKTDCLSHLKISFELASQDGDLSQGIRDWTWRAQHDPDLELIRSEPAFMELMQP